MLTDGRTDGRTDGQTDGQTDWGIAIALSQIGWLGAKNWMTEDTSARGASENSSDKN